MRSVSDGPIRAALAACLSGALILCLSAAAALAERRVALVIGNGAYEQVGELVNPVNDAVDMTQALQQQGFEVFPGLDLDRAAMERMIDDFGAAAATSDVALFYYAGHAFQVNARNYLLPVDFGLGETGDVIDRTIPLDRVFARLQQAPGIRLVFLDSCRDNPLGLDSAAADAGLARIGSSEDFWIAYATQPDAVAFDGDGRNGTFTEALLSHIHAPGRTLTDLMIAVRRDVIAASGGQQIPWENSSLTRQFRFDTGPESLPPESLFFQVAARTRSPDLMRLFVERYPDAAQTRDAAALLADGGLPDGPPPNDDGEALWLLLQQTRLHRLAQAYVELYPEGRHIDEARWLRDVLPADDDLGDGKLCERLATHPRDATANTAGVPFSRLQRTADSAVAACTRAVEAFPQRPSYVALLARATWAAGRYDAALDLYRQAADMGDLRAMFSLGLLMETGEMLPRDPAGALALYEQAAHAGSTDAMINLAVALFEGRVVAPDTERAIALLRRAADQGSAIATFNLGVLARDGVAGTPDAALGYFRRAAREGEPRGWRAAAILLDQGEGTPRDPEGAADMLLRGAAADDGEIVEDLTHNADLWTPATIRAVQTRLQAAGRYRGAIDGLAGPQFAAALLAWRTGGFDPGVLGG